MDLLQADENSKDKKGGSENRKTEIVAKSTLEVGAPSSAQKKALTTKVHSMFMPNKDNMSGVGASKSGAQEAATDSDNFF